MFQPLESRIVTWRATVPPLDVPEFRRAAWAELAGWIASRRDRGQPAHLVFVCTHNSRRSHMAQLWAHAAAQQAGLSHVVCHSGGTEATAFFPSAVAALRDHGFQIEATGEERGPGNPVYHSRIGPDAAPIVSFSKVFTDPPNPPRDFAAVMVCSAADEACPFVPGAAIRISLPFEDPKRFDGTDQAQAGYLQASREIGSELTWVMGAAG